MPMYCHMRAEKLAQHRHLAGEQCVDRELERRTVTVLTDVVHGSEEGGQQRRGALDERTLASHEDDELTSIGLGPRADHGSVEEADPVNAGLLRQALGHVHAQRRAIDGDGVGGQRAQRAAILVEPDGLRRGVVFDHGKREVDARDGRPGRLREGGAGLAQRSFCIDG